MAASDEELERAFRRGLEIGRREEAYRFLWKGLPAVTPWTRGVRFERSSSLFESLVAYERGVLEDLRRVQCERWLELQSRADLHDDLKEADDFARRAPAELRGAAWPRRWRLRVARPWQATLAEMRSELVGHETRTTLLDELQHLLVNELREIRQAVDAELDTERGQACTVQAMRSPPTRPLGVRELPSVHAFVGGDQRRSLIEVSGRSDVGGEDYGYNWRLENPLRRWVTTRWRVSWLCLSEAQHQDATDEVYAVEHIDQPGNVETGRVWLMGTIPDRHIINEILPELETHAQHERNSLVVVAARISEAAKAIDRRASTEP